MKRGILVVAILFLFFAGFIMCLKAEVLNNTEKEFAKFLDDYLAKRIPLSDKCNLAYWQATATGEDKYYQDYEKYNIELDKLHSSKSDFEKIKKFIASREVKDPVLARELQLVYNEFASCQIDEALLEKIIKLSTKIEKMFYTSRGKFQGKEVSDNDLLDVLSKETDSSIRKDAWQAQKSVGKEVAPLLLELVKLRNEAARKIGYKNYYEMMMTLNEQDVNEVFNIFDELATLTDEPFKKMKNNIDSKLSGKWGIKPDEMRPWHYQDFFFQEAPDLGGVDLDAIFEKQDVKKLIGSFYASINLNVDTILQNSDLYERKGKYQHAYCTDIDRNGDVRTMCNLRNNSNWAATLLHELGHCVYAYYSDRTLPYLLRDSAHIFVTEGIAMMFERLVNNPEWLVKVAGADPKEIDMVKGQLSENLTMGQLVFSRWSQVMLRFERALYENPDQDLNKLWWDLVERYQYVKRPKNRNEPDWASKIHFTSSPVYYHNYQLGGLFASQLLNTMAVKVLKKGTVKDICFAGQPELGAFLISKVFYPGMLYPWNEMIKRATGENLNPKYYVEEFVK